MTQKTSDALNIGVVFGVIFTALVSATLLHESRKEIPPSSISVMTEQQLKGLVESQDKIKIQELINEIEALKADNKRLLSTKEEAVSTLSKLIREQITKMDSLERELRNAVGAVKAKAE